VQFLLFFASLEAGLSILCPDHWVNIDLRSDPHISFNELQEKERHWRRISYLSPYNKESKAKQNISKQTTNQNQPRTEGII
jgi:hypothetical protein